MRWEDEVMMNRGWMVLATAATVALGAVCAARADDATASAGADVVSAYIFRGATVNDEVNVQPALGGSFYGASLGTWANFNTDVSQFDEIDYTVGYGLPLGEESPMAVALGYTEYTYPTAVDELGAGLEADREVSVGVTLSRVLFSPSATVFYGIEGPFLEDGLYIELKAGHKYALSEKAAVNGGVTVGLEEGDNVDNTGVSHVRLNVGASYGTLALGLNYIMETDSDVLAVDEDFYGSLGVTLPL
jgi:hypothetical protein